MARLQEDWFECKLTKVKDKNIYAEIRIKYIPLRLILPQVKKYIGWKIWLYPRVWNWCLSEIGLVIKK